MPKKICIVTCTVTTSPIPEGLRVARGQIETMRLAERIKRRDVGRPPLEIMDDDE